MTNSSSCCRVASWLKIIGLILILGSTAMRIFYQPVFLSSTELNTRFKDQVNDLHYVIVQQGKLSPMASRKSDADDASFQEMSVASMNHLSNLCLLLFCTGSALFILGKAKSELGGSCSGPEAPKA